MPTKQELQATLEAALGATRFAASKIRITSNFDAPDVSNGITTYKGQALCFDYEWTLTVAYKDDYLQSVKLIFEGQSSLSTGISLVDQLLTGQGAGDFIKNLFPKNFPFEAGITPKELELGFTPSQNQVTLKSIRIKYGTFSDWKILNTDQFDLTGLDVELENDDISVGLDNISIKYTASTIIGPNPTTLVFSFGSKVKDFKDFKENIEITGTVKDEDAEISIRPLMKSLLPPEAFTTWDTVTPPAFKELSFKTYMIKIKPFKKELHVVQDTENLGGLEVILKPTELAALAASEDDENSSASKLKHQRNILIALTPPPNGSGTFFGDIGREGNNAGPLAALDELDLSGAGLVFSTYDDATEVNLEGLQTHKASTDEDAKLKVKAGLQLFANVKMRSSVKEEQIIQSLFNLNDEHPGFILRGFISKDLKSYELEMAIDFGNDVFIIKDEAGRPGVLDDGEVQLKEVAIAFIAELAPIPYVGFRIRGVIDTKIKEALLRFMAGFAVGGTPPSVIFEGEFAMAALNDSAGVAGAPPVWRTAFGVKGLGIRQLGIALGISVTPAVPAPIVSPTRFDFNGDLLLGTVLGEEVSGMVDLKLDTKKPTQSIIKIDLTNVTLIDIIEAFDDKKEFNLQGPVRDMLTVGFEKLAAEINPPEKIFSFDADLALGTLKASCLFQFQDGKIAAAGSVTPIEVKSTDGKVLFGLSGKAGTDNPATPDIDESRARIAFSLLEPTAPKFVVDGKLIVLGGDALDADAKVDITHEHIDIDTSVKLFGGVYEALVRIKANSFTTDGTGMYAKVSIKDEVIEELTGALRTQLEKNYNADREKIEAAQAQLAAMRGKDSFLDEVTQFASGFLDGLKDIQDDGRATGGMLLQVMQTGFNVDHIKFEGDLSTMSSTVKAEVQLTVAGRVINAKIEIDLLKGFADILTKLEKEVLVPAFSFLGEEFGKLLDTLNGMAEFFNKGAEKVAEFTESAVAWLDEAVQALLDFLKNLASAVGEGLDAFFNGAKVVPAEAGGAVLFTPGVDYYRVICSSIRATKITDLLEGGKLEIYGYVILDPEGTMRLGRAPNDQGNIIAFSKRRGDHIEIDTNVRGISHIKHFYFDKRDGGSVSPRVVLRTALREKGLTEIMGDYNFSVTGGTTNIDLKTVDWNAKPRVRMSETSTVYARRDSRTLTLKTGGLAPSTIELVFTMEKFEPYDAATLKKIISKDPDGHLNEAFNHGADPALPGLMEAALDHEDPEARIKLLLGHQVKPRSSDLDKAVEKDNWAALNLLMGNGAKPTVKLVDKAIDLNKPNRQKIIKSILEHGVAPTGQNLTKAFAKGLKKVAELLLQHNPVVTASHLASAIDTGDADLVRLVLRRANQQESRDPVLTGSNLAKAVDNLEVMKALLEKPILDQAIFQPALKKASLIIKEGDVDRFKAFNKLRDAGARIIGSSDRLPVAGMSETFNRLDIVETLMYSIENTEIRADWQYQYYNMLRDALKRGGDATDALRKSISLDDQKAIRICLEEHANPDAAISYAVGKGDAGLLLSILQKETGSNRSKANGALKQVVQKSISHPNPDNTIEAALAGVALDAGADPNGEIKNASGKGILFLDALGEKKRYRMVDELLRTDLHADRIRANPMPAILRAIEQIDGTLLETVIVRGIRFGQELQPFNSSGTDLIETALKRAPGHSLVDQLLKYEAPATTAALALTLKKEDFITTGKLVAAGAKGAPPMYNEMMEAGKFGVLVTLRPAITPDLSNFQLAADLDHTTSFHVLAGGDDGRLSGVGPLRTAIEKRNLEILKKGLEIGGPATEALAFAVEAGWKDGVQACLEAGAAPKAAVEFAVHTADGSLLTDILDQHPGAAQHALEESLLTEKAALATIAINKGADPNLPLAVVADRNQDPFVRLLVEAGATPDLGMMGTIRNENPPLLQWLIDQGADAAKSWYLELALELRNDEIVKILLDNGANPKGLLEGPVKNLDKEIVRLMILAGADATEALRIHLEHGNGEMLIMLIKMGADLNPHFHIPARRGQMEIIKIMVEQGADPTVGMQAAVEGGRLEIVKFLLLNRADAGEGALMMAAVERSSAEMVNLLVSYGARVDIRLLEGNTLLIQAAGRDGDHATVKALLDAGADPNVKNDAGDYPLHVAVPHGDSNLETVKLLADAGADLSAKNADGRRVLYVSRGEQVISFLRSRGAQGRTPIHRN